MVDDGAWGACQKTFPLALNFPTLTPLNQAIPIKAYMPAHDILPHLIYQSAFILGPSPAS